METDCTERHREARQRLALALGPELGRLRRLDPLRRLGELLFFLGLLAFSWSCDWLPLALLGTVVALNSFVLYVHEGMHGLIFARAALNRWVSVALGGFVLISHSAYHVMHDRHHRYLGDPRDPDDYDNYSRSPRVVWAMHFLRLGLGSYLYLALIPFLALRHGTREQRRRILEEYAVLGTAYFLVLTHVDHAWLGLHWGLPLLLVGLFTNLRGLTQHGIADAQDPYLASRSVHLPPFLAFLLLHENYHLEHHLFPEVPSYHLPELHRRIYPLLPRAVVTHSYGEFLWAFLKATPRMDKTPIGLVNLQGAQ